MNSKDDRDSSVNGTDKYSISLRFFGDDLDPDEISRLLGSVATDSVRRGELVIRRTRSFTATTGSWHISTEQNTDDIEAQILALFERLTSNLSVWNSLTTRFQADIFCGVFLESQGHGFEMTPRLHRLLADRNLLIVFDIYASDGPE